MHFCWDFTLQSIISFILILIHSCLFYTGKKKNTGSWASPDRGLHSKLLTPTSFPTISFLSLQGIWHLFHFIYLLIINIIPTQTISYPHILDSFLPPSVAYLTLERGVVWWENYLLFFSFYCVIQVKKKDTICIPRTYPYLQKLKYPTNTNSVAIWQWNC